MGTAFPVIPGTLWELTRRSVGQKFLFRPDPEVRDAILYCFGYSAERWGMLMHFLSLMMNHYHDGLTDVRGTRVEFITELHGLIAMCIKALRGDEGEPLPGAVWEATEQTGRVMIVSDEAFIEACAYAIANPVAAGLAHSLRDWPGFVSSARDMLERRSITVKRPRCLSDHYPETATLRFCVPAQFEGRERWLIDAIDRRVSELLREARKKVIAKGGRFRTREELMRVSPFAAPPKKRSKAEGKPTLRAANGRIMRNAKRALNAWRKAYRSAFEAFRAGMRDVVWPVGTWFYAKYAGVRVAESGAFGFGVG